VVAIPADRSGFPFMFIDNFRMNIGMVDMVPLII
jgi:hypothetical protein